MAQAETQAWERLRELVRLRFGRPVVRTGRIRFSASEIMKALASAADELALIEGVVDGSRGSGRGLNPVSLGRWLNLRLADAPIGGHVLRSAKDRTKTAHFWVASV
jgi:hypothetical protein